MPSAITVTVVAAAETLNADSNSIQHEFAELEVGRRSRNPSPFHPRVILYTARLTWHLRQSYRRLIEVH